MKAVLKPADEHVEGITIVADRFIVSILLRSPTLRLQAALPIVVVQHPA
jgi:hypothetical protein